MKKLLCAMLAGVMCFGLTACGSDSSDKEPSSEKEENKEEKKEEKKEVYEMNETVKLKDRNYTVTKVATSKGKDFMEPKEGKVFVLIDVTIENTSDKEISYNTLDFEIQNTEGQINGLGFVYFNADHPLGSGKLAPGGKVSGTIVGEETGVDGLVLIYKTGLIGGTEVKVNLKA